jgi:hypothetical protein
MSIAAPAAEAGARNLECRARGGDRQYALFLDWDGNVAHGILQTTMGGRTWSQKVQAELYKALVLVNPAGSPSPEQRLATVREEGEKTMQVGDWRQPWLACE